MLRFVLIAPIALSGFLVACSGQSADHSSHHHSAMSHADMHKPATNPEAENVIAMGCIAENAAFLTGKEPTPELIEKARVAAEAQKVRVLKMGEPMTMEYNGGRLNVLLDRNGKVMGVNCG